MPLTASLIHFLALYLGVLALGAWFSRHKWPAANGHLLAGLVLGPLLLAGPETLQDAALLTDLAIFFLLFQVGLNTDPAPLMERPAASLAIATGGFVLPLALGYGAGQIINAGPMASAAMGLVLAMSVTAVGPPALVNLEICQSRTGHVIQGAAAAGHYLSLGALSMGVALAGSGGFQALAGAALPFALAWVLVRFVLGRITLKVTADPKAYFVLCMAVAVAMGLTAHLTRTPLIVAAFLAGQVMRLETANREILETIQTRLQFMVSGFLAPLVFGVLGALATFSGFSEFWMLAGLLFLAALAGKIAGTTGAALACGRPAADAAATGAALTGIGAAPLAAAAALLATNHAGTATTLAICPLLDGRQLAALIAALLASASVAPVLLRWIIDRNALAKEKSAFHHSLPPDPRSFGS
ncbi:MAG: cation:proton antiporter [Desulfobacterales bacterium]|nr:cation:proton antiporter [Desulfobacterales bacterium]